MPVTLDDLLAMRRGELHDRLCAGHPVPPGALDDREYNGVSLCLPRWIAPLAWEKFKKVFHREPGSGLLRGWNVAAIQNTLDQPWVERTRRGRRVTYGHYVVRRPHDLALPGPYGHALILDYTAAGNSRRELFRFVRDPVVAVNHGEPELLLGFSWAEIGFIRFKLPFYFALLRGAPLGHVVEPPRPSCGRR